MLFGAPFRGGYRIVHQSQRTGNLEVDPHLINVLHRTVLFQLRSHTMERSAENPEIIQTDTVSVRQLPRVCFSSNCLAHVQHIFRRHATQSINLFRDTLQIIHLRIARLSFQGIKPAEKSYLQSFCSAVYALPMHLP